MAADVVPTQAPSPRTLLTVQTVFSRVLRILMILLPAWPSRLNAMSMPPGSGQPPPRPVGDVCDDNSRPHLVGPVSDRAGLAVTIILAITGAVSYFLLPKGRARWTLRLLETKVIELGIVDRASDSTIGRALKKTLHVADAADGANGVFPIAAF
jgi:hypothetical protein